MKYYKLNNQLYQEPLPSDFDIVNAVEITSPVREDGTLLPNHENLHLCETKEDGSYYEFYNADYTADKIAIDLIATDKYVADVLIAVQECIDDKAKSLGYDDMNSTAKYLRPSSPSYNECVALGDWTDLVWAKVYSIQADIKAGTINIPTVSKFVASLPK